MKERLCKFIFCLVAIPWLLVALVMIMPMVFVLPILALIKPSLIVIKRKKK